MMAPTTEQEERNKLTDALAQIWSLRNPIKYSDEDQLYTNTHSSFEVFWDPPDDRYHDVLASTVLLSRRISQFKTTPYPFLFGPKGSGKTQALELLSQLCYKPLLSPDMSTAAIFQIIEAVHPTLLLDETDSIGKVQNESVHNLLQILNAGYRRGQRVVRGSREGSIPRLYDVFGLKVLSGTEPLPDTLADRTIRLDCEKNVKDIPLDIAGLEELQGQLEMYESIYSMGFAAQGNPQPKDFDVDPEELKASIGDNRTTQLFLPLYMVCPTDKGRRNLFELAKEQVEDRKNEESTSDLNEVMEAVWITWDALKTERLPLDSVKENCSFETKPAKTDPTQWLAYRLKKLQLKRERVGGIRYVVIPSEKKLIRLARRYCPHLTKPATLATSADTKVTEVTWFLGHEPQGGSA